VLQVLRHLVGVPMASRCTRSERIFQAFSLPLWPFRDCILHSVLYPDLALSLDYLDHLQFTFPNPNLIVA
jgi:hypothetical protein